jgi:hypothetical protein
LIIHWNQFTLYSHLHRKNSSIQFFTIAKRGVMLNVAAKKLDCFVH